MPAPGARRLRRVRGVARAFTRVVDAGERSMPPSAREGSVILLASRASETQSTHRSCR